MAFNAKDFTPIQGEPGKWINRDGHIMVGKEGQRLSTLVSKANAALADDHAPTYRESRAEAYRDELGKEQGDYRRTFGDVIDTLITEVVALSDGKPKSPEMQALVKKVQAIKRRIPQDKTS
jgi:hypothetical protein